MKQKEQLKLRIVILMIIACCFAIIPSTFSLYRSNVSVNGDLSLARWRVSLNQTGVNNSFTVFTGGEPVTYTVNLESIAEVDIKYSIALSNLPAGVEVSLDGGIYQTQSNNSIIFTDVGTILYTDSVKTRSHTLSIRAASGATTVNNQTVNINVLVQQIL